MLHGDRGCFWYGGCEAPVLGSARGRHCMMLVSPALPLQALWTWRSTGAQCMDIPWAEPWVDPNQEPRAGPEVAARTASASRDVTVSLGSWPNPGGIPWICGQLAFSEPILESQPFPLLIPSPASHDCTMVPGGDRGRGHPCPRRQMHSALPASPRKLGEAPAPPTV